MRWWSGYLLNVPMDLDFEVFQLVLLVMSTMIVSVVLHDGKANWLKGSMLISAYVLVAWAFWYLSDREFRGEDTL